MLDLHWIRDDLAVGARYPMELAGELASAHRVQSVVDVRLESCDDVEVLRRHGMELLHLPTLDTTGVPIEQLDTGVVWVRERLTRGHRVFIHCEHGIGRSALVGLCVLVDSGHPPLDALRLMKIRRPVVSLSEPQQVRYVEWCARWSGTNRPKWALPSVEDVRDIAWSRLGAR